MDRNWRRQRINPTEYIRRWLGDCPSWITFDSSVRYDDARGNLLDVDTDRTWVGRRRTGSAHDGTVMFTHEIIVKILEPILLRQTTRKFDPPEAHPGLLPAYRLGWIRLATTFPRDGVNVPAGRIAGQRDRVSVSYRIDWVEPEGEWRNIAIQSAA